MLNISGQKFEEKWVLLYSQSISPIIITNFKCKNNDFTVKT